MPSVTAGALIAAGLKRADMTDSPTGFIQHPASGGGEAFDLLTAAYAELYDLLLEGGGQGISVNRATALTDGTTNLLPFGSGFSPTFANFYRALGVELVLSGYVSLAASPNLRTADLDLVNFAERFNYQGNGVPRGYGLSNELGGASVDGIIIYPFPSTGQRIILTYAKTPQEFAADTDTINLLGPWREFLELHFAIACLTKEKSDCSDEKVKLLGPNLDGTGGVTARIRTAIKKRDSAKPSAPVDVQAMQDGFPFPDSGWRY
jgi:hypothetical protein